MSETAGTRPSSLDAGVCLEDGSSGLHTLWGCLSIRGDGPACAVGFHRFVLFCSSASFWIRGQTLSLFSRLSLETCRGAFLTHKPVGIFEACWKHLLMVGLDLHRRQLGDGFLTECLTH